MGNLEEGPKSGIEFTHIKREEISKKETEGSLKRSMNAEQPSIY